MNEPSVFVQGQVTEGSVARKPVNQDYGPSIRTISTTVSFERLDVPTLNLLGTLLRVRSIFFTKHPNR